jgi:hypothetical protein
MQSHPLLNPMMLNPMMMSMIGMGMNPMNMNQINSLMQQQQQQIIIPPSHAAPPVPVPLMHQNNVPLQTNNASQNTLNGSHSLSAPMPLMAIPPLLGANLNGEKKVSLNPHQLSSLDSQNSLVNQRPSKIEAPPVGTKIMHPEDDISLVIFNQFKMSTFSFNN